jgi:hypothetical protein
LNGGRPCASSLLATPHARDAKVAGFSVLNSMLKVLMQQDKDFGITIISAAAAHCSEYKSNFISTPSSK